MLFTFKPELNIITLYSIEESLTRGTIIDKISRAHMEALR